jgi:hypothetical protein
MRQRFGRAGIKRSFFWTINEHNRRRNIKIGYVPKQDNAIFARLIDAGKFLFGKITSKEKKGSWVRIYIKVFLHE